MDAPEFKNTKWVIHGSAEGQADKLAEKMAGVLDEPLVREHFRQVLEWDDADIDEYIGRFKDDIFPDIVEFIDDTPVEVP